MLTHSRKMMPALAVLWALGICPLISKAVAQSAKEKKGQIVTITGCVQKGDAVDEFAITENGKKYGVKSTSVKLADHLGHEVTVTGNITRPPGPGAEEKEGEGEYADVKVTSLKMISTSCQ